MSLAGGLLASEENLTNIIHEDIPLNSGFQEELVIIGIIDKNIELSLEFDPKLQKRIIAYRKPRKILPSRKTSDVTTFNIPPKKTVHGSIVTSIINKYAQNANYILVDSFWDKIDTIAGLEFIKKIALSLNKPAVVNLSAGVNAGPHDGTSLFEQILAHYSNESFHTVVAGGNMGSKNQHIEFSQNDLEKNSIYLHLIIPEIQNAQENNYEASIDLWLSDRFSCSVEIYSPQSAVLDPISQGDGVLFDIGKACVCVCNDISKPLNGKTNILTVIKSNNVKHLAGKWTIKLTFSDVSNFICDGWLALSPGCEGYFTNYVSAEKTIQSPSTGHKIISVGVFSEQQGKRIYRSQGPTIDGRSKPDIFLRSKHHTSYASAYFTALLANSIAADKKYDKTKIESLLEIIAAEHKNVYLPKTLYSEKYMKIHDSE
jgi:hypothetical protein